MIKKASVTLILIGFLFIILLTGLRTHKINNFVPEIPEVTGTPVSGLTLSSSAFTDNGTVPSQYTCDGENIAPPLSISGVSPETKSLVLTVDDPDAPAGDWVHWLVWNLPPDTGNISQNNLPAEAVQGTTSFGKSGYGGPCPPGGEHQYVFTLYSLDTNISLNSGAKKPDLDKAIAGHIISTTRLVGLYRRK